MVFYRHFTPSITVFEKYPPSTTRQRTVNLERRAKENDALSRIPMSRFYFTIDRFSLTITYGFVFSYIVVCDELFALLNACKRIRLNVYPVQYSYWSLSSIRCVFCSERCSLLFVHLPGHCGVSNNAENIATRQEAKNKKVALTENGTHKSSYSLPTRAFNFIVALSGRLPEYHRVQSNSTNEPFKPIVMKIGFKLTRKLLSRLNSAGFVFTKDI